LRACSELQYFYYVWIADEDEQNMLMRWDMLLPQLEQIWAKTSEYANVIAPEREFLTCFN
jgi:hypothetical protein